VKKWSVLLAIGPLFAPWPAAADAETDAMVSKLTGGATREWVMTQVQTIMGAGGCSQGEVYKFAQGGSLTIDRCVNGQMEPETHHWQIGREGPIDIILDIDRTRYRVLIREAGNAFEMRLRHAAAVKADPSEDRVFRYERD
jgi:hypothetical protein